MKSRVLRDVAHFLLLWQQKRKLYIGGYEHLPIDMILRQQRGRV